VKKFRQLRRWFVLGLAALALSAGVTACGQSKADVAAKNLSQQAEAFKIERRIVFINGITDKYLAEVIGYCSVETTSSALGGSLQTTCQTIDPKTGEKQYIKDYFGLSDNVTYTVEQLKGVHVSTAHVTVLFRPGTIVPDIDTSP
jgi:hypothetical protein